MAKNIIYQILMTNFNGKKYHIHVSNFNEDLIDKLLTI